MPRSRPNPIGVAGALVAVLLPLVLVGYLGAGSASLWLDEITYYRLQGDLAFRAAEIGRSGSAIAPFFSNFFFCDIQRAFQAPIVALGLIRPLEHPEWLVRALPIVAYAATALLIVLWRIRREGDAATALLGGLLFAGAPIFLFYAFEGRVYAFVSLLAVALLMLLERASRSGGAGSLAARRRAERRRGSPPPLDGLPLRVSPRMGSRRGDPPPPGHIARPGRARFEPSPASARSVSSIST